jgi:hypothetical protein
MELLKHDKSPKSIDGAFDKASSASKRVVSHFLSYFSSFLFWLITELSLYIFLIIFIFPKIVDHMKKARYTIITTYNMV